MMTESIFPSAGLGSRSSLSNDVARRYTPRIRRHAARFARRLPPHIAVADLVSAGYEGLVHAFGRFDTSRSESFEAYLDHRIRGAILDELRDHDPLTRDQRVFARRISTANMSLAASLGRAPTQSETAEALGMDITTFHGHLARMSANTARNSALAFDDEAADVMDESGCRAPDEAAEWSERRATVCAAMGRLSDRLRLVLKLHYEDGRTLRQIADELGVTESRVSQIHSEAIVRLRKLVAAD